MGNGWVQEMVLINEFLREALVNEDLTLAANVDFENRWISG
jgi:hypothetical protein